ncbi:helix-turn-helix transcriptional regulator [Streptomyces sp. B-S-A8]|uniref:Helix-turn-helix transcriptional regulator n=1 Tax=Streptomyces solicavernae TaxID=3043614 RepID=A0ABT6RSC0_9ACTN|nr:helix-turn-helix transcriptional regulator [Streptomyces sp. B-S-A8]MDI3387292.1 helix-turn-helix transcriptional regulator [Streptomyces sp. B-S-A8]
MSHTRWKLARERKLSEGYNETPEVEARRAEIAAAIDLGQLVYDRRTSLGLSQTELAKRARMTQPQISSIESGGVTPTVPILTRLAKALNAKLNVSLEGPRDEATAVHTVVTSSFQVTVRKECLPSPPAALEKHLARVTEELSALSHVNSAIGDATLDLDTATGEVTISVMLTEPLATSEAESLANDVMRTAIHAAGGSTANWGTQAEDPLAEYRRVRSRTEREYT